MDVSIFIPCVDMPKVTKKCVELIWQHTPPIYELIIVCDRPGEEMKRWLAELGREKKATVITNPEPVGTGVADNMGYKVSKGKCFCMVNNDVEVTPDWLEPLIEALELHPEFGWATSKVIFSDTVMTFGCPVSLFSREALDKIGFYDETFSKGIGADDDDLYRRFLLAGYEPHGIANSVAYHPHSQSTFEMLHGEKHSQNYIEKYNRNREILSRKWNISSPATNWDLIPWI